MAEYIDREKLYKDLLFGDDDDCIEAYSKGMIEEAPTADVVERSKIDKAIEVITTLRDSTNRMITGETSLANECYKQYVNCFDECLRIIKEYTVE